MAAFVGVIYFVLSFGLDVNTTNGFSVNARLKFTEADFDEFMANATLVGIILGGTALAFASLMGMYKSFFPMDPVSRRSGCFSRMVSFANVLFYTGVAAAVFVASLPVFTRGVGQPLPPKFAGEKLAFANKFAELHVVSSYGLFRRMTGVGGRPEVIIEGNYMKIMSF